ncbi:hypothetical protein QBC41DRAFT_222555 [Cercophora samala]|uniref:Uncharacterized protein n=1 Tax=Cercophora samala TaxID=330535 RepID=A0AA39ZFI6_9PEZI|nr:hypothetical protein QBC41DRAFT_222555 [Cercophora samala]
MDSWSLAFLPFLPSDTDAFIPLFSHFLPLHPGIQHTHTHSLSLSHTHTHPAFLNQSHAHIAHPPTMDYLKAALHHTKLTLFSFTENLFPSQQPPQQQQQQQQQQPHTTPPPTTSAMAEEKAPQPTSAEAFLFYSIVKNLRTRPDINWEGVARDNGFKNAETAKVRYGQVKRKLNIEHWSPPVKAQGGASARAAGSGVGKTEMEGGAGSPAASSKPKANTGAGVKKTAAAAAKKGGGSARKTAAAKGKNKGTTTTTATAGGGGEENNDNDGDDDEEEKDEGMKPANIDAVLARLSPTPVSRAQRQRDIESVVAAAANNQAQNVVDVDNYISSLQQQQQQQQNHGLGVAVKAAKAVVEKKKFNPYPPRGFKMSGEVYRKAAIPVRGLGDGEVWTYQEVSVGEHGDWFHGLSMVDQNRFMEEAVEWHVKQAERGGGGGEGEVEVGGDVSALAPAAATAAAVNKGKKLGEIPYHPGYHAPVEEEHEREEEEGGDVDMGIH